MAFGRPDLPMRPIAPPTPAMTPDPGRSWCERAAIVTLTLCLLVAAGNACAQSVDSTMWCSPDAKMFAMACSGDTLYLAGNFSQLGPAMGGGVPVDRTTGQASAVLYRVAGSVDAVLPDGAGGWYLGGNFVAVDGKPHRNLAHLGREGPDEAWQPDANGEVTALARDGDVLYVGGEFDTLGGVARAHLAAVDIRTGLPTAWDPQVDNGVWAIEPHGTTVYIGGHFRTVGGQVRRFAAAVDSTSGVATAWSPTPDGFVRCLAVRDTSVFLGGDFTSVGSEYRFYLAKVGCESGLPDDWDAQLNRTPQILYDGGPRVCSLVLRDSLMYVAGWFNLVGDQRREGLVQLEIATARLTSWDPHPYAPTTPGAGFNVLALSGDTLFVAGYATSIGGEPSDPNVFCAVSAATGARIAWDPRPNYRVVCMAPQGDVLYAGGQFRSMGSWVVRRGLAAVDLKTGLPTSWDPNPDYYVQAMKIVGNTVYVGGPFSSVGGLPRSGLAALDRVTGQPTAWNPSVGGSVRALAFSGDRLLVGGYFSSVGGQPRANIAAVDTATGQPTAWAPEANSMVMSLAAADSVVYVGGDFSYISGRVQPYAAAVDTATGTATAWAPTVDGPVNSIAVLRGTVYLGGNFNFVNGEQRDGLAALDAEGMLEPWSANASRQVYALAVGDSTVYAGGGFSTIGGEPRFCVAAIHARTGEVRDWYPAPDGVVWSLDVEHGSVFVGGAFERMGNWPQAGFAVVSPADPPVIQIPPRLWLAQNCPNPAASSALIRYALPEAAQVSLSILDVQGRAEVAVLSQEFQAAGPHSVSVSTAGLRPGCYFYRLQAGGASATRKMVVLR